MNKVFRVIWSEAQGAWVAVSETTKSHSKRSRKAALALALAAGGLMGVTGYASATGLGEHNTEIGTGSIVIGPKADDCSTPAAAKGDRSVSIGCEAGTSAAGNNQTNLGYQAGANSEGTRNTALGSNTGEAVKGNNNTAVGQNSGGTVKGNDNAAVGSNAGGTVTGDNNLSFGSNAGVGTKGDANVAVGLNAGKSVVGGENAAFGSNAGESVEGSQNTGFGRAAGKGVKGNWNTSLGDGAGMNQQGDGNLSAGRAAGQDTYGDYNIMLGNRASTVGSTAGATINRTVVIGSKAEAHFDDTVALGTNAKAEHENSVALGSQSQTRAAESVTEGVISYKIGTDTKTYTYSGFAGVANGVVSVGSAGAERQIINVAPGAITSSSTDAVNGSQLYGVAKGLNDQINNLDLGGGWVLGSKAADGTTDQDLTIATGKKVDFNAGKNMEITSEPDADGNVVSTFKTKDDVDFTQVTTGDTVMNKNGLTITNGPSITKTGINAGDLNITNVKAGIEDTHGVNVSQLKGLGSVIGDITIDNSTGAVTGPTFIVNGEDQGTVSGAIKKLDEGWTLSDGTKTQNVKAGDTATIKAGDNMDVTIDDVTGEMIVKTQADVEFNTVTTGDTVMNTDGVTVGVVGGNQTFITNQGLQVGDTFVTNGGLTFNGSTVAVTAGGINAGGEQIKNVAAGTELTDGVNFGQLKDVAATAGQGWYLKVNDVDADRANVAQGETMGLTAGKNMVLTQTGTSVEFTTTDEVDFTTVTTGDTVMSDNGLTIVGGPSITKAGINAGNLNITNVKAGTADTHGVNVSQLKGLGSVIGDITIDNSTGEVTGPTFIVNGKDQGTVSGAITKLDEGWTLSDGDKSKQIKAGDTATIKAGDNMDVTIDDVTGEMIVKTQADVEFNTVTTGDTVMNTDGVTVGVVGGNQTFITNQGLQVGDTFVTNGGLTFNGSTVAVTAGGINAGGEQIKNVAAGTELTDGVNLGQLKDVEAQANKGWNVSTNGGTANGGKTANVAPDAGVDFSGGKNIVVSQDGTDITISTADNVEFDNVKVGETTINQDSGITVGGTNINNQGDITVGDVSITAGGINAGDKKITGVKDGTIAAGSKDAVNGGQIHDLEQKISEAGGWELSDGTTDKKVNSGDKVTIKGGDNIDVAINDDGDMIVKTNPDVTHDSVTTGDTVMNDNGVTIKDGPSITKNGVDAGGKKVTGVADGDINKDSTDAVNGSQLDATNNRVTKNEGDIKNIQKGKDGMFQVSEDYNATAPEPTGNKSAAGGAGAVASGDNSTAIGNDAKATASNSTALGNSAWASANNSVALGQGSVADRANSVSVGTVGGERQITNVAAGVAPTDAVNVSQLDALGSKVNQYFNAANKRIDKVDNNARAGIAAAMAAGTLPQSTLPGKSMVTVGASTYRGESAIALGVSRLSDNARTVIKANASADSRGNAGAAVGAGWHW